uniref:VWFA domain-containing protein n=1 Tax=Pyricularia oryzae (strain P131) TaxID=1143193 RepID=L7J6B6_PYRO1
MDVPSDSPQWTKVPPGENDLRVHVYPLASKDGILIKVKPPRVPKTNEPTPTDLVLVIDVSPSMQTEMVVPTEDENQVRERFGFTVLDLVGHACLTILETLTERDRLGIVMFKGRATVLQGLTLQDPQAKERSAKYLGDLRRLSEKWHCNMLGERDVMDGLQVGLQLFNEVRDHSLPYRVPAVMLVTDSHLDSTEYTKPVASLKETNPEKAQIHTFGFGYNSEAGVFKAFSEISGGRYTFIPDSSMIGTAFVHAMANIRNTAAFRVCLNIKGEDLKLVSPFVATLREEETTSSIPEPDTRNIYRIQLTLGSIHFGQSRDVYLAYERPPPEDCVIQAELVAFDAEGYFQTVEDCRADDYSHLSPAEVAYHVSRAQLCRFLSSLFPLDTSFDGLGGFLPRLEMADGRLAELKRTIPARRFPDDDDCASLMTDLEGAPPRGQISLALSRRDYRDRWGGHYLLGLLDAHTGQVSTSHKDEGPLRYGRDSPILKRCRDALNAAFDHIEPPRPSIDVICTPAPPPYRLAGDGGVVPISWLRAGISVATPAGPRAVRTVLRTRVRSQPMVRLPGGVVVTPWHPVKMGGDGAEWMFPAAAAAASGRDDGSVSTITYSGFIYSLLLEAEALPDGTKQDPVSAAEQHAFCVGSGGVWAVAMGHGLVDGSDVRAHAFYGDRNACLGALATLPAPKNGVATSAGVLRDATGRVIGFRVPDGGGEVRVGTAAQGFDVVVRRSTV